MGEAVVSKKKGLPDLSGILEAHFIVRKYKSLGTGTDIIQLMGLPLREDDSRCLLDQINML
jgi:hypothetical protein